MMIETNEERPSSFSVEVGQRLRNVRRARGLSLDDVERDSGGRWSASAIGAYERGFRNLSLPRLRELAEYYGVPMSVLLGEEINLNVSFGRTKLVVDLVPLRQTPEAAEVMRYLDTIIIERGDFNGRVLSVRHDDMRALCALMQVSEDELFSRLQSWGALHETEPGG